jgi:hypothetical protein
MGLDIAPNSIRRKSLYQSNQINRLPRFMGANWNYHENKNILMRAALAALACGLISTACVVIDKKPLTGRVPAWKG